METRVLVYQHIYENVSMTCSSTHLQGCW